jgi:hypothetical protein
MSSGNVTYSIDFVAAIARLEEGTKAGARHVKRMADEMEGAANFARNALLTLGGALGVFSFSSAIKQASEAADAAAKMGDRFGIATEKIIGLQHAGALAGASNEALATALRGLANSGVDAARGSESAARAYAALKINASEFINLPMDRQFTLVIERLGGLENATLRNALAQDLLGKSAGEVMGLVAEGGDAIRKATEDAEAWGLALNRVDAAKLELANDAMTRAKAAAQGVFTTIAINLSPAIKLLADRFADSAVEAKGFKTEVTEGMQRASDAVGGAIWFVERLQFAWSGLKYLAALAINGIIQSLAELDRAYTDTMNSLAASWIGKRLGMEAREYSVALSEMADVAGSRVAALKEELEQLALGARDLDQWQEVVRTSFRQAADAVEEEARRIAEARQKMMGGGEAGVTREGKEVKEDPWQKQVAERMERLAFENATELEQLQIQLEAKQNLLDASKALGIISEEEHQRQTFEIFARYQDAKTRVEDDAVKKRYGIAKVYRKLDMESAAFALNSVSGLMQSESRKMFEVGKAAAIGETVINTYAAAMGAAKALASILYVGPFLAAAAAAAMIVVGMERVRQIRSTQFGGGSVSGGASPVFSANPTTGVPDAPIGASAAPPPVLPQAAAAPRNVNITLITDGGPVSQDWIRFTLLPGLNEALDDRATITVN